MAATPISNMVSILSFLSTSWAFSHLNLQWLHAGSKQNTSLVEGLDFGAISNLILGWWVQPFYAREILQLGIVKLNKAHTLRAQGLLATLPSRLSISGHKRYVLHFLSTHPEAMDNREVTPTTESYWSVWSRVSMPQSTAVSAAQRSFRNVHSI